MAEEGLANSNGMKPVEQVIVQTVKFDIKSQIDLKKMAKGGQTNSNRKRLAEQAIVPLMVKLGIKSQDGDEVYYRFQYDKKLQYLFMNYCKTKNLEYHDVQLVYDSNRVLSSSTPAELGLKDGDIIDAMMHQYGGGF